MYMIIGDDMKAWKDRKKYYLDNDTAVKKSKKKYFFTKTMKHQTVVMMASVAAVFLVMFGTSYAVFSSVNKTEDFNGVNVGDLHIDYKDESGAVSLANSYPISDEEGLRSKAYTFSVQNTGSLATTYSIKLLDDTAVINGEEKADEEMADKLLDKNDIKVSINDSAPVILGSLEINNYELLSGKLQPGETKKISVKVWIKSDASNNIFIKNEDGSLTGKYFFGKITVEGENTKTYETDSLKVWLDGINNGPVGHDAQSDTWYDLSKNSNDYSKNTFKNATWKENGLNISATDINNVGFKYDTSSLEQYTISMAFKLNENKGTINLIDTNDVNIYLKDNELKFGNLEPAYSIENNKLYVVSLIKGYKIDVLSGKQVKTQALDVYINGEFYKDIIHVGKENTTSSNINIDICNYLVYEKALTVNKENNNYILTRERFGE